MGSPRPLQPVSPQGAEAGPCLTEHSGVPMLKTESRWSRARARVLGTRSPPRTHMCTRVRTHAGTCAGNPRHHQKSSVRSARRKPSRWSPAASFSLASTVLRCELLPESFEKKTQARSSGARRMPIAEPQTECSGRAAIGTESVSHHLHLYIGDKETFMPFLIFAKKKKKNQQVLCRAH